MPADKPRHAAVPNAFVHLPHIDGRNDLALPEQSVEIDRKDFGGRARDLPLRQGRKVQKRHVIHFKDVAP